MSGVKAQRSLLVRGIASVILSWCTGRQLLGATKQTKNRARLLPATPQRRLALRLHILERTELSFCFCTEL